MDSGVPLAAREKAQDHMERRKRWEGRMLEEHGENWRHIVDQERRRRAEHRKSFVKRNTQEDAIAARSRLHG
jgi:hypothetical protein